MWREVRSTGGYQSTNVKEQHFGLGGQTKVDVSVRWPNGERSDAFRSNRFHCLAQWQVD